MATNYPAALDTFSTKVDGVDDVLAADINKLQDAVLALQGKLGTNASNLTLRAATSSVDPPDIEFQNGSGVEIGRIWKDPAANELACRFSSSDTPKKIAHDTNIMSMIAGATTAGGVGTYALLFTGGTVYKGNFYAGSVLRAQGAGRSSDNVMFTPNGTGPVVSGTWLCMSDAGSAGNGVVSLFMRAV